MKARTLKFILPILAIMALLMVLPIFKDMDESPEINEPSPFVGRFGSDGYEKRQEGYDWVLFNIQEKTDGRFDIKVRSRTDIKKPTCTYEGIGQLKTPDILVAPLEDGKVNMTLTLKGNTIDVWMDSENFDDRFLLMRYCSGGGSLAGKYYEVVI